MSMPPMTQPRAVHLPADSVNKILTMPVTSGCLSVCYRGSENTDGAPLRVIVA